MATIDLTDGQSGAGVVGRQAFYLMEKTLDWAEALDQHSATVISASDIFQVLDLPAEHMILHVGAEVIAASTASTVTIDIDVAAGDDMVDGADATSTGYCAAGTEGNIGWSGTASSSHVTYVPRYAATDTIDVTVASLSGVLDAGKVRVYALVADIGGVNEKSPLADVTF